MYKKVAIVIVNWNGLSFLENCLKAVFSQSYRNFDVYFVDNGSKDDSINYVRSYFSEVKIIQLETNTGYAKGNNVGILKALQDPEIQFVSCLNNDTMVDKYWLEELIKTAETESVVGAATSKAYFDDGITIQNAGLEFYKVLQVNKNGGISIGFGLTDEQAPELSKDIDVFAPGGVAPLYKREVLEKLMKRDGEIFDENFFAYVEDYDLGFRINSLGYKSRLSSRAKLIHLHSKTGGVASAFKAFYCERNAVLAAIKNLPLLDLLMFPLRNLVLKVSYLTTKNSSIESFKEKRGVFSMITLLIQAHLSALMLTPHYFYKRYRMSKYEQSR